MVKIKYKIPTWLISDLKLQQKLHSRNTNENYKEPSQN